MPSDARCHWAPRLHTPLGANATGFQGIGVRLGALERHESRRKAWREAVRRLAPLVRRRVK